MTLPRHSTSRAVRKSSLAAASLLAVLAAAALLAQQPAPQNNPPKLERNPAASLATPTPVPKSNVTIRFVGITHFDEKLLRSGIADEITELNEQGVNPATADDAGFFLGIFYRNHGYANVNVTSKVLGSAAVELDVDEGPLTLLDNINFIGVTGLPVATLRDYISSTTRERFPNPKTALPFVQADVDTGVERIRGLYASEGFLDSVVDPPQVKFNKDNTRASVSVTVHEGIQYHFGKISFEGDLVFYPNTELLKQLQPFT